MPGVSRRRAAAPGKRGARRLSERQRQAAALIGQGVTPMYRALGMVGLSPRRATVSEITASAEGQAIIQSERAKVRDLMRRWVLGGLLEHLAAMWPDDFPLYSASGRKRRSSVSRGQSAAAALKREILQAAELLGPEVVKHQGSIGHEHRGRVRLEDLTDEELATLEAIKDRLPEQGAGDEGSPDEGGDPDGEGEA